MGLVEFLKSLPIDLGQANLRSTTKGKLIALEMVPDGRGRRALDIGCREGTQSGWLESRGYEVTSIDIESNYQKARIVDANKGLPFADDTFDVIWSTEVIEHLDSPEFFARECERTLKPGGKLVLTTPNSTFWLYPLARLFGKTPADLQHPGHKHFFGVKDVRSLFPRAAIRGYFPYAVVKFPIKRAIGFLSPTFVVEQKKPAP